MGKSEITGADLSGFGIQFSKSKLLDMYINGIDFTRENVTIYGAEKDTLESKEQQYFFYSQLRKIHEAQGDMIATTKYHSLAMKYQEKILEHSFKANINQKTGWQRVQDWLELITFRINAKSNRHGESWPQALLFTFIASFVLYIIYCASLYEETMTMKPAFLAGEYFSFLDPTHKSDFLAPKQDLNFAAKTIDFLGRIVIAYSIFQLIAAFRRHGRKAQ